MAEGDEIGIRIVGRYQGQNIVQTMHYKILTQTATDHEILQLFCTAWMTTFLSTWLARHIDTYTLVGLKTFSKTGNNKRPGMETIEDPGTIALIETPSPVCRVITLYTDSDNHWRRGRIMLSGSDTTMFNDDDGAVTDTETTSQSTLADMLIDTVTSDEESFAPGLCAGTGIGGPYGWENFTAALPRRTPACIRSRRVRGFSIG